MEESFDDVIIMKVGPHSGMSLQEIIDSKNLEEKRKRCSLLGLFWCFL